MIVDPRTTDGAAYITECLKASRTPQLFFKMVHRDGNGNITSAPVYDTSQIKSYKISDSICNNSDYSVGNVPNMEFDCEVFNSTDDTENVVEMEVFFNPFDDASATVRQDIENTTVGNAPSNPHTARIATFYRTGAYFYEGLMVFRGVDAVGLHTNAYWPDNDNLTYPVTGRQLLNSALLWGGFKTIPASQSFVNLDDIAFSEPPVGYTIRQVLEILCAMEGANLVHVNDFRSSGGAEYDFKVAPMYPGRYTFASLAGRSLPEMWAYDTNPASYVTIHDSNIFNIKRLQKPIVFAGVQYAGTYYDGSTAPNGSTYYLEIPQNEMLNNLSNATLATYMNRLADIYKGWNYFPINMTCVSVPFVQDFDRMFLPEQNLAEAVVTSTNLTGLGSETIVTAGNTVPMNDYRYSGKGVSRYDKNAAMLNRLYKYIYPGKDNIAIGGVPLKYSVMPPYLFTNYFDLSQKGKATFDSDVDFQGKIRIKDASGRFHSLGNSIVQRADSVNPLTASGWYRVFECDFLGSANALGSNSQFVDITVRTSSTGANGTLHSIRLSLKTNDIEFVDEMSDGNANRISQIRYMTKGQYGYIDVYFNNGGGNLYSSTDLIARPYQYDWVPVDYTSVVEAPTGETQQAIYSFTTAGHVNPLSERIDGWLTANGNLTVNGNTTLNSQLSVDANAYLHKDVYLRDVANRNYNLKLVTPIRADSVTQISTAGWYRVFTCNFNNNDQESRGVFPQFVDLYVRSSEYSSLGSLHSIRLALSWNEIAFVNEVSNGDNNGITQIRYTTNGSGVGNIDVYYAGGANNYLSVDLIARPYMYLWTAVNFTTAPSGETVQATHSFIKKGTQSGANMDAYFGGEVFEPDLSNTSSDHLTNTKFLRATSVRSISYIDTTGWYRFAQYDGSSAEARGAQGCLVDIALSTSYSGTNNQINRVSLVGAYDNLAFLNETSRTNNSSITKVRYITDDSHGYLDFYYNATSANNVNAEVVPHFGMHLTSNFRCIPIASVGSAPSGETVRAEHTFTANTPADLTLSATNRGTMLSSRAYRAVGGEYVFVNFVFKASTTLSNSPQCATTINALMDTPLSCIDITSGIGTAITSAVPCGISTLGRIYIKEIVTDHIYAVSGFFIPNQNS